MGEQRGVPGADSRSAGSAVEAARRRGARPVELARYFCVACAAIAFEVDARCLYCQRRRPAKGWAALRSGDDPWLGRIIAERYLITRRIARGVAARVYEAESLNIHRQFAVKIVDFRADRSTVNPAVVEARLRREIAAMSRLQSPHIVRIFEALTLSPGCVALVMEYIRAPTLGRLLRDTGALQWARACAIARQIACAGHAVHEAGLVHRDLKPANMMVESIPGGDDFIHLLDFGIVWAQGGAAITNGFVGTPLYASPEQARGGAIDARSDIYSLGVILFEMLVGRPPFESAKIEEVLRMHVRQPAPGLQESATGRTFPPRLSLLVAQMLQKPRDERPPDLLALIEELDAILASPQALLPADEVSVKCGGPEFVGPGEVLLMAAIPRAARFIPAPCAPAASAVGSTVVGHGVLEVFARPTPSPPPIPWESLRSPEVSYHQNPLL